MKPFQLTRHALADLEEAVTYLAEDSAEAALGLVNDLEAAFLFLVQWPLAGHHRTDLAPAPLRFWVIAGYLIVYEPFTKPLSVVAVLHGSRDGASILKDRRR